MKYLLISILAASCGILPPPTPPQPDTDLCGEAEQTIERLQCKDRRGDPMWINKLGEPFQETCRRTQTEGGVFLNPRCIKHAQTCEEVNECPAIHN